jgi:hypothetical protein
VTSRHVDPPIYGSKACGGDRREFADGIAPVAVVSAGVGAPAGGIAGSFAAGVGFADGVAVSGISGLAIGPAGGAIGCGIGWAVEG